MKRLSVFLSSTLCALMLAGCGTSSFVKPTPTARSYFFTSAPAVYATSTPLPTAKETPEPTSTPKPTASPKATSKPQKNSAPKSTAKTAPKPTAKAEPKQEQTTTRTVYITNTGKKYHRSGCRYLSKSEKSISLSDAKNRGYTPCSVCKP